MSEIPNDQASGAEELSALAQEANGIAFLLASAAYLTLAGAYLRIEGSAGLTLMDQIEDQITEAVDRFTAENLNDVESPAIVLHAMRKVRALLDAGRTILAEARPLQ